MWPQAAPVAGFGAPAVATGGFGAPVAAAPFGVPAATAGYAAPAVQGFGAPAAPGFGVPPAPGGFGAPAATGGFGAPAATGGFGAPAAPGGFGAPAGAAGYGAPAGAAPPLGGPAPAAMIQECAGRAAGDISIQVDAPGQPVDAISGLTWSPSGNLLCSAGWDAKARVYQLVTSPAPGGKMVAKQESTGAPILDAQFLADDQIVICGLDRMVQVWNITSNVLTPLGVHDAGVRNVRILPEIGAIVSTGFDKALRVFDPRSAKCVSVCPLREKAYAMDAAQDLIVVGEGQLRTSSQNAWKSLSSCIECFNVRMLPAPERVLESYLRLQTRSIGVFKDAVGFIVGGIEGRCAVHLRNEAQDVIKATGRYAFRSHRNVSGRDQHLFGTNAICTHPNTGATPPPGRSRPFNDFFITGGGNGSVMFWDRRAKRRTGAPLQGRPVTPVTAMALNSTGTFLAYAHGYDWSKGANGGTEAAVKPEATSLHIHSMTETDMTHVPRGHA